MWTTRKTLSHSNSIIKYPRYVWGDFKLQLLNIRACTNGLYPNTYHINLIITIKYKLIFLDLNGWGNHGPNQIEFWDFFESNKKFGHKLYVNPLYVC